MHVPPATKPISKPLYDPSKKPAVDMSKKPAPRVLPTAPTAPAAPAAATTTQPFAKQSSAEQRDKAAPKQASSIRSEVPKPLSVVERIETFRHSMAKPVDAATLSAAPSISAHERRQQLLKLWPHENPGAAKPEPKVCSRRGCIRIRTYCVQKTVGPSPTEKLRVGLQAHRQRELHRLYAAEELELRSKQPDSLALRLLAEMHSLSKVDDKREARASPRDAEQFITAQGAIKCGGVADAEAHVCSQWAPESLGHARSRAWLGSLRWRFSSCRTRGRFVPLYIKHSSYKHMCDAVSR